MEPTDDAPYTDLLVFYPEEIPRPLSLELPKEPRFKLRQVRPPFPPLDGHLGVAAQHPVTPEERAAAGAAKSALNVRCDEGLDPSFRLENCVQIMHRCFDGGAVAILLLNSRKLVGPTEMKRLKEDLAKGSRLAFIS